MMNEYKKIVLLKGLEVINDYHFTTIKSLLAHDLKLTRKMQDEYDRIKIADLMEENFRSDAGVEKLIELLKDIPALKGLVKKLRAEKLKVSKKFKSTPAKGTTLPKKKKQEEVGPDTPAPTTSKALIFEGAEGTQVAQNKNTQAQHQVAARRSILQKDPMIVMVLKATEPFEYESPEEGKNTMFHATVATESQFFRVKVFNASLKEKFTKDKVIIISDYFKCKGILEINKASFVYEAGLGQKIMIPRSIIKRASETPKIDHLSKQVSGTIVYGLFSLQKKKVNKKNTIYEIQDDTGIMDVVGNGKWHNIKCEEGDKLRLFCFQLRTVDHKLKLMCGTHSLIKVVKTRKSKKEPINLNLNLEVDIKNIPPNQLGGIKSDFVKIETFM
ncbi:PREDICTED: myeloid cell nuclear differentiation antigen-like isoform X2 [Galeopterus variegatus]|uniref:Myeloid cell nuclear differentiation antigen-like isoform X2 n=1 Tax=Galeopterus variegatus TaxID=482537 RepID=A0ABM0RZZ1_GALVR|nr:PREDICTED: myeloid cell nuclear differentiation antigen-like isoform X2 [Galeopterus variegatus]